MEYDPFIVKYQEKHNVQNSTKKRYQSAVTSYTKYHGSPLQELIHEAKTEQEENMPLVERSINWRLVNWRKSLLTKNFTEYTVKTYVTSIITLYKEEFIEIPYLPRIEIPHSYVLNYDDLPTHEHIRQACEISDSGFKALILFMASSGSARAETLSLQVKDFINGCREYVDVNKPLLDVLHDLQEIDCVVPTIHLRRLKTDKYYYTFCSDEASTVILEYLLHRRELQLDDKLFPFSKWWVLNAFSKINDKMNWGYKGKYRFFRSHALRKFHASNIGLHYEDIDALQGRSKNIVHETYIKPNPTKLKRLYMGAMDNLRIYPKQLLKDNSIHNYEKTPTKSNDNKYVINMTW